MMALLKVQQGVEVNIAGKLSGKIIQILVC